MIYSTDLHNIKNTILDFYPFRESDDDELICNLKSGEILVFKFFPKGGVIDLLLRAPAPSGYKEKSVALSFSFENEEHRNVLKDRRVNQQVRIYANCL